MSPEAELDSLDWVIEVFGDRYGAKSEPTASGRPREQVPVSISEEALWLQLEHLPVRKAVPPDAAPSVVWRACSAQVTQFISDRSMETGSSCCSTTVGGCLSGLTSQAENIMRLLIVQARECIHQLVQEWPQCAYLPHYHGAQTRLQTLLSGTGRQCTTSHQHSSTQGGSASSTQLGRTSGLNGLIRSVRPGAMARYQRGSRASSG